MEFSKNMGEYFDSLQKGCFKTYKIAQEAKSKGYDPSTDVETELAATMAQRVIGLISVVAPQLKNTGAEKRIEELEAEYGVLDWRVALKISEEIAQEKFCKFKDQREAMEIGIRTGFTYVTVGVVSSPLEGLTELELKDRLDGKGQYFCLKYSGPIRNAGGTAAAVSVLIADYVRVKFGFKEYDPTEKEIKRCHGELEDYHDWITNLQYFPSKEESDFLMQHLPVEISGEPSEKYEVSNVTLKDIPRVNTNILRSGYCLIHSSCIPLKAPKLWAQLSKWGEEFDLGHWNFLEEFLKIQKKSKAMNKTSTSSDDAKVKPDFTYIKDLVAGRPVLGHPMKEGAFRLRYGRSRTSGYSAQSIHPATMQILNSYIATGTQVKLERPGKAAAYTPSNYIDGPIVKLLDGSVVFLETEDLAKKYKKDIKEILFLGDTLICYGDFFNRAHNLVPPGYCPEFWILELEKAIIQLFGSFDFDKLSDLINVSKDKLKILFNNPIRTKLSAQAAIELSKKLNVPFHPFYIPYWNCVTKDQFVQFLVWFKEFSFQEDKIILPNNESKRILELIGLPHLFVNKEHIVIEKDYSKAIFFQLGINNKNDINIVLKFIEENPDYSIQKIINHFSPVRIRDKSGIFIGSRMGRPEKAKMRKLTGSPHVLFPVGAEGGRFRSFQSALEEGKVTSDFAMYYCEKCKKEKVLNVCEDCGTQTKKKFVCQTCGLVDDCEHDKIRFKKLDFDINSLFNKLLKKLGTAIFPDLIKGVKATFNRDHVSEHLIKGILRAKNSIYVNKDGTIRYDSSEIPITHFKPKEIGVSVEKLKGLGYKKDIHGNDLIRETQVLELKPQDVILPCCPVSPNEPADEIFFRTSKFIDELLTKFYGLKPFYNLKTKEDIVGHFIIGLAPHTSAGILGRIIGFSKTQGFFSHPMFHAAMRRDCDGDESCFLLLMDTFLNFSRSYLPSSRGSTMDAPLVLTYFLNPAEVDDMVFHMDIAWKYPLKFYEAAMQYKMPWEVNIKQVADVLNTADQFEGLGYTHGTRDINSGVLCSAYKLLPSMEDKLKGQMNLATKIRCVDESDVARLVIEKHFLRDTKGNLRKFSTQTFRCVACNTKYRRPPLIGKCIECGGKIIFTVSEGSVIKYLKPSISLAVKYNVSNYLKQTLELTQRRVDDLFGREKEKQEGLGKWFG